MADHGAPNPATGKRPAPRGTAFYPRKRANKACQVCRARKTKCDNKKPQCSYCETVGAVCIQSEQDLSSFDPASLKILERLDTIERLLKGDQKTRSGITEGNTDPPLAEANPEADPPDFVPESVLPETVEDIMKWPCFSHSLRSHDLIHSTPHIGNASPAIFRAQRLSGAGSLEDIEPARVTKLLDNFFTYAHCKNPILDELTTRKLVRRILLDDGIDWSASSCLSLIIMAVGCVSGPFGPSQDVVPGSLLYTDSQFFFQAAQKRIGSLLSTFDIIGAQCLFLSGVYYMSVFQPMLAWRFFAQSLAACQHFPFLARKETSSDGDYESRELENGFRDVYEQAIYWSAWKSEQELRNCLSLPDFGALDSRTVLYPPFFPTPPYSPPGHSQGAEPHEERARSAWLFYLAEISLRRLSSRLRSDIIALCQMHQSGKLLRALIDLVPEYESQARDWSANLPHIFSLHDTSPADDEICRSILRCHLVNLYELLYWAITLATINLDGHNAATFPNEALLICSKGLEAHAKQLRYNEPGYMHRHHGTFFMIKSCSRSVLVLLAARAKAIQMPLGWMELVYNALTMMDYWESEVPEVTKLKCVARIEFNKYLE